MRGRARIWIAVTLAVAAVGTGAGQSSAEVIDIPWTELLPPIPTAKNPQPGPVANCREAKPKCVRVTIQRLRALRNRLGCDHRAVFATTYLELTNYAALNARLIAAAGLPGYGATRDAYCAAGPSGG